MNTKVQAGNIEFTRINNDVNGNPRYVCHFYNLLSDKDSTEGGIINGISTAYNLALSRSRKLGGKKFHNKQYGGGIVFQSYNIADTAKQIKALVNN